MNAIDPILFQQNSDIHIRVWFNDGERGFQHLQPDRPFASVPYALAAGNVGLAPGSVTVAQLDQSIVEYLQPEIVAQPSTRSAVAGGQIELTVETYGRNLAYQWLRNGEILDGQTQPTLKFESFDPALHAGDYILETTNPFGTVSSDVISISEIIVQSLAIRASFPEQHDMLISFDVMEEVEVLFTAHGPSLETPNASEDPDIYLQDANENLIHRNDDWDLSIGALESFGVYSLNDLESAILHVLAPGSYSVRARDLGDIAAEMEIQLHTLGDASGNAIQNIRVHAYLGLEDGSAQFQTASFAFDSFDSLDLTSSSVLDDSISTLLVSGGSDLGELSLEVVENQPIGTTLKLFDTIEFPGEEISFSLVSGPGDDNNSLFNFDSIGALKTADVLDYEASNNLRMRLRIADERNATLEVIYLVTVTDDPTDNDQQSPVIELVGDSLFIHPVNTPWVDPGFTASDETDGILSDSVNVTGELDLNRTGIYTLTYSAADASGNESNITRTIRVVSRPNHTADLNSSVSLEMIWVEPGTFTMGQDGVATPVQHEVTLTTGFYLGKYEVTQAQYEAVMTGNTETDSYGNVISATPSEWPNNPDRPVEKVSWEDIQVFLTRLNAQEAGNIPEGWAYVLPTEAQWEYACRAGTTTAYSWGDTIASDDANYNWDGDWNTGTDFQQSRDVGQYSANPWGFFDMHGNVWEWTADALTYGTYGSGAQTDPFNAGAPGTGRVARGGSWFSTGADLRSALPGHFNPSNRFIYLGFRVGFQQTPVATAPVITILNTNGTWPSYYDEGSEPIFPTFEYSAIDDVDGDISSQVTISTGFGSFYNEQHGTEEGSAFVTFTVTDSSGNASTHTEYGPAEIIGGFGPSDENGFIYSDSDGDGIDDAIDAFPEDPTQW